MNQQAAELASTRLELAQSQTGLISATLQIEKLRIELARLRRDTYGAPPPSGWRGSIS